MKKLLLIFALLASTANAQLTLSSAPDSRVDKFEVDTTSYYTKTAACGTPWLSSGYPAWTNYWGGYQFNIINLSASDIMIHSFEARFQGTSGYRIYTKTGTFVGFETNAASWTLVGSIAGGLTGLSTTAPTPIPITVDICIPAGATQAFYLTRTDNLAANRHLYVPGTGTPGTTLYASNADIGLTEAHYVSPFFAALYAQSRRPSLDVCYSVGCSALPIELIDFNAVSEGDTNKLFWATASERDNSHFIIERSSDTLNWDVIGEIDGQGNSTSKMMYLFNDNTYSDTVNYYRLTQVDFNGGSETFKVISVNNTKELKKLLRITNYMGQDIDPSTKGFVLYHYSDGSTVRKYN